MTKFLMIEKSDSESWEEAVRKYDNVNHWKVIIFQSNCAEYFGHKLYDQERNEIKEWAKIADSDKASWLGTVYFIHSVPMQSAADYEWSALRDYSCDTQILILEKLRKYLVESEAREAKIEKMRSDSQFIANNFKSGSASNLSQTELKLRRIALMDDTQLEELLTSKEYATSHESIKAAVAERYLSLQAIDKDAEWNAIEASDRYG